MIEDDTDEAPIGREPASSFGKSGHPSSKNKPASPPPSAGKSGSGPKVGRRPTMTQPSGMKSPPPRGASDSDVRLVPEGSGLDFQVVPEGPKSSGAGSTPPSKSGPTRSNRPSKLGKSPDPADSGVRIVPLEDSSDSDVKLTPDSGRGESGLSGRTSSAKKPSDSDIRLEDSVKASKKGSPDHPITEEIDLDEEERRADPAARTQARPGKTRPKVNPLNLPTSSPFELSEADIEMDKPAAKKRPSKVAKPEKEESSSDFELKPIGRSGLVAAGTQQRRGARSSGGRQRRGQPGRADGTRSGAQRHQPSGSRRQRHLFGTGRQRRNGVEPRRRRHSEARPHRQGRFVERIRVGAGRRRKSRHGGRIVERV